MDLKGNNVLRLNQATLAHIIQQWMDRDSSRVSPSVVSSVKWRDDGLEVLIKNEDEKVGANPVRRRARSTLQRIR